MKFDTNDIGILLFYTIGALLVFAFALIYWTSKRSQKTSRHHK